MPQVYPRQELSCGTCSSEENEMKGIPPRTTFLGSKSSGSNANTLMSVLEIKILRWTLHRWVTVVTACPPGIPAAVPGIQQDSVRATRKPPPDGGGSLLRLVP